MTFPTLVELGIEEKPSIVRARNHVKGNGSLIVGSAIKAQLPNSEAGHDLLRSPAGYGPLSYLIPHGLKQSHYCTKSCQLSRTKSTL